MTPERRSFQIKAKARALGFDAVGITDLSPPPHGDVLHRWLESGYAGTMGYMHRQEERRLAPESIAPGTKFAVVVTKDYCSDEPPPRPGWGRVARYARGRDYHRALRTPLEALAGEVRRLGPPETVVKTYVDAGPVPERELAQRAGLGWIGKNTMLIDPARGSYCFLASVLTDLELAVDAPFEADRCGTCRRCLDACPTNAFVDGRMLDSRRCISYLTIEHRGNIAPGLHELMGDWVFGCDVCQDVCPWNHKFATARDDGLLEPDPTLAYLDPQALARLTDEEFRDRYGGTALARPGLRGIQRNAAIVSANSAAEPAGGHS